MHVAITQLAYYRTIRKFLQCHRIVHVQMGMYLNLFGTRVPPLVHVHEHNVLDTCALLHNSVSKIYNNIIVSTTITTYSFVKLALPVSIHINNM